MHLHLRRWDATRPAIGSRSSLGGDHGSATPIIPTDRDRRIAIRDIALTTTRAEFRFSHAWRISSRIMLQRQVAAGEAAFLGSPTQRSPPVLAGRRPKEEASGWVLSRGA